MNREQELLDYLIENHTGKANAIHSKDLEAKFNIASCTVRRYVSNMRKSGIPICSDETGYWIAANPREVNGTIKRLGNFMGGVGNAKTGLAYATIQMRSVTKIKAEKIQITVKVV